VTERSSDGATPALSIGIVSWNTRDLLAGCLASLPAAVGDLTAEVIVADNASRDGTADLVRERFEAVTLLETGANLGFARATNLALARARGRKLLLLNPDTVCPPGSLRDLCDALDRLPDAVAIGPNLTDHDHADAASWGDFPRCRHHWQAVIDPRSAWLPRRWRGAGLGRTRAQALATPRRRDPHTGAVAVDYVKGACLLTTREAWERVGPLDEQFFLYFEETDWCRRARAVGGRVYLCPDVSVQHLEGQATGLVSEFSERQFQHSYRLYLRKHHGEGAVRCVRRALAVEYGLKGRLRWLSRRPEDQALAARYRFIAALQREDEVAPAPPE